MPISSPGSIDSVTPKINMRVVYFDCFSGISGDMALGALIDAVSEELALVLIIIIHILYERVHRWIFFVKAWPPFQRLNMNGISPLSKLSKAKDVWLQRKCGSSRFTIMSHFPHPQRRNMIIGRTIIIMTTISMVLHEISKTSPI